MLSDRRKLFNEIAPRYELLNHLMSAGRHRAWRRAVIKRLRPTPELRVLDLCGGTGDFSRLFQNRVGTPLSQLVIADLSEQMLQIAQQRFPGRAVQADALQLPFRDEQFDLITCGFGMRNLPDAERGLQECFRLLAPGGRLVVLDLFRPHTLFTRFFYNGLGRLAIPVIGLVARRKEQYTYLLESLQGFVTPSQFASWMETAGFVQLQIESLDGGIVSALYGTKPLKSGAKEKSV